MKKIFILACLISAIWSTEPITAQLFNNYSYITNMPVIRSAKVIVKDFVADKFADDVAGFEINHVFEKLESAWDDLLSN